MVATRNPERGRHRPALLAPADGEDDDDHEEDEDD